MRMTREQFEKLLYDFSNAAAESWRKDTIKEYNNSRSEILAEFDRLNAEIERLKEAHPYRWYQELIDDLNSEIELMQQENMYSDDGGDDD